MDIEWLDSLETRVRDAAERLQDLKEENGALKARVQELETELSAVSLPPAESGDADRLREENEKLGARIQDLEERLATAESGHGEASERWVQEREEIRRRVETLTRRLEELAGV